MSSARPFNLDLCVHFAITAARRGVVAILRNAVVDQTNTYRYPKNNNNVILANK